MNILIILLFIIILSLLAWALFGTPGKTIKNEEKKPAPEPEPEPEKIFRRRASDRAIEEEYPERRHSDDISHENISRIDETQAPFELPYSANSIIPDNSRFRMYKRTLINSEIYARKGDIDTAISLFNGVKERISDKGIKNKIDTNIEYLNHFREMKEKDQKKRFDSLYSGQQPGELRLKIDGPVPQTINIGIPDKAIDSEEVIKKISEQISSELGNLKSEIEKIKSKPEERFDLDDYARFAGIQNELATLKERFNELSAERDKSLEELNRIREIKEEELVLNREREKRTGEPEKNELLNNLKDEIRNLTEMKKTLDSLNSRIDDLATFKIPETKSIPSIIEARYQTPIPVHFDPKPVLEILDKINRDSEKLRESGADKQSHATAEEYREPSRDDYTDEEIKNLQIDSEIAYEETEEDLFPAETPAEKASDVIEEVDETFIPAEETIEKLPAADILSEPQAKEEVVEEIPDSAGDASEELFHTGEDVTEATDEVTSEESQSTEEVTLTAPAEEDTEKHIQEEISEKEFKEPYETAVEEETSEKIDAIMPDEQLKQEETPRKPAERSPDQKESAARDEKQSADDTVSSPVNKEAEKEKEIDRYTDIEEDPNAFELLSEYGRIKDDSTLTDEEIFEKIITEDSKKSDENDFEILGDKHKEEQEYSFDEPLDEKKKAEQDFYKKFIKPDRIKKKELPILKVSYDFKKLPDEFSLSREKNILEYSFYKYKPMLEKADEFIKQRRVRDAINYYKVVNDQNIPPEFKLMIRKNIRDLTEYLEKYLATE